MQHLCPEDPMLGARRLDDAKRGRNQLIHLEDKLTKIDEEFVKAQAFLKESKFVLEHVQDCQSVAVLFVKKWFKIKTAIGL